MKLDFILDWDNKSFKELFIKPKEILINETYLTINKYGNLIKIKFTTEIKDNYFNDYEIVLESIDCI